MPLRAWTQTFILTTNKEITGERDNRCCLQVGIGIRSGDGEHKCQFGLPNHVSESCARAHDRLRIKVFPGQRPPRALIANSLVRLDYSRNVFHLHVLQFGGIR
jgi:hypothetical protein